MIRLDKNENCYPLPVFPGIAEGFPLAHYPDYGYLTGLLAAYFSVPAEELLLTNGADEAIDLTIRSVSPRSVIVSEPTFSLYEERAQLYSIPIKKITAGIHRIPIESFARYTGNKNLTCLANPANPSGVLYSANELYRLARNGYGGFFLIDETYAEFSGVSVIRDRTANMIIVRSFSKAWGLAGLRLGCVIAEKGLIAKMKSAQLPFSVNALAVNVMEAALADPGYVRSIVTKTKKDRISMARFFRRQGFECRETAANFILVKPRQCDQFITRLAEHGIIVKKLNGFENGWVRITVCPIEMQKALFTTLANMVAKEV